MEALYFLDRIYEGLKRRNEIMLVRLLELSWWFYIHDKKSNFMRSLILLVKHRTVPKHDA
jgi:hypothetical protein